MNSRRICSMCESSYIGNKEAVLVLIILTVKVHYSNDDSRLQASLRVFPFCTLCYFTSFSSAVAIVVQVIDRPQPWQRSDWCRTLQQLTSTSCVATLNR